MAHSTRTRANVGTPNRQRVVRLSPQTEQRQIADLSGLYRAAQQRETELLEIEEQALGQLDPLDAEMARARLARANWLIVDRHGHVEEVHPPANTEQQTRNRELFRTTLLELEDALRRARRRGPRGPFTADRPLQLPEDRAPILYALDFQPTAEYARAFMAQTLTYVHRPEELLDKRLGMRAMRVIIRLLLLIGSPGPGRLRASTKAERLQATIRAERQRLLKEAHDVTRLHREDREACRRLVRQLIQQHLPELTPAKKDARAKQLVARRPLRAVDVANQIPAWRHRMRPAQVQKIASR